MTRKFMIIPIKDNGGL